MLLSVFFLLLLLSSVTISLFCHSVPSHYLYLAPVSSSCLSDPSVSLSDSPLVKPSLLFCHSVPHPSLSLFFFFAINCPLSVHFYWIQSCLFFSPFLSISFVPYFYFFHCHTSSVHPFSSLPPSIMSLLSINLSPRSLAKHKADSEYPGDDSENKPVQLSRGGQEMSSWEHTHTHTDSWTRAHTHTPIKRSDSSVGKQ